MDFFTSDAFLYSLISAGLAIFGGIIACILPPNPRIASFFGHFVAGVILAAVALELVTKMQESSDKLPLVTGFAVGASFMLLMRWLIGKLQKINSFTLLVGSMIDLLVDGFLLGISFYIAYQTGKIFALSLAACAFFVVFFVTSQLRQQGKNRGIVFLILLLLAIMPTAGTIVFEYLSENSLQGDLQVEILSFATAALLYLAIEEIIKEAREQKISVFSSLGLFIGFLLVLIF